MAREVRQEDEDIILIKVQCGGRWWLDLPGYQWCYSPPGLYDPGVQCKPTIQINGDAARQLITALEEAGWLVSRLDERLRVEDLRITHRLMDIIEKQLKGE